MRPAKLLPFVIPVLLVGMGLYLNMSSGDAMAKVLLVFVAFTLVYLLGGLVFSKGYLRLTNEGFEIQTFGEREKRFWSEVYDFDAGYWGFGYRRLDGRKGMIPDLFTASTDEIWREIEKHRHKFAVPMSDQRY